MGRARQTEMKENNTAKEERPDPGLTKIKRIHWRSLQYAGIPVAAAALLILHMGKMEVFDLLRYELIIVLGYTAAILDLKTKRIPNSLILAMFAVWVIIMTPKLFLDTDPAIALLKESVLGFAIGGGLFLLVYLISRKGLGGGDVKFMAGAGLYLGFGGTISAMFCGTVFAALAGLTLILLKKIGRKDKIPLAPFLYIGILLTVYLQ